MTNHRARIIVRRGRCKLARRATQRWCATSSSPLSSLMLGWRLRYLFLWSVKGPGD